jgi:hypothetical protein
MGIIAELLRPACSFLVKRLRGHGSPGSATDESSEWATEGYGPSCTTQPAQCIAMPLQIIIFPDVW